MLRQNLFYYFIILTFSLNGQITITGTVKDLNSGEVLIGANIAENGSTAGTASDLSGNFRLVTTLSPATVSISYVGYGTATLTAYRDTSLIVYLKPDGFSQDNIVISASRFAETILQSPITIYKLPAAYLQNNSGGDYYESLKRLPNIDVVNNSFALKIFNTKGFGTTSPFRIVQTIDGMENTSPVLTFSLGTMFNVPDIDIDNIEIISGPASALYGPNAFQGVINIKSKDPFIHKGLTVQVKAGNRKYAEGQIRIGGTLDKKKNLAMKLSCSYFRADDWQAKDPVLNNYRKIPFAPQRIAQLAQTLAADTTLSAPQRQRYADFNNYIASHAGYSPGNVSFTLPGYDEKDLADNKANSLKILTGIEYKLPKNLRISYLYKFNMATAIYQGNNRAFLQNFRFNQHKLELKGKNFFIKQFFTHEDMDDSYDLVLTGINLGIAGIPYVNRAYLDAYIDSMQYYSANYSDTLAGALLAQIKVNSMNAAQSGWLVPGTDAFNTVFQKVSTSGNRPTGSLYNSRSMIYHIEGQYDYTYRIMDLNVGASFRRNMPRTKGQVFSDTLLVNGEYANLAYNEYGGFVQLTTRLAENRLKILTSLRIDKSENFKVQFSPRAGIVYNKNNHGFRASFQTAFRSPTLNDQYFYLNTGSFILKGNLSGYNNLYTTSSVTAYAASPTKDSTLLQTYVARPIAPEQVNTLEIGYRMIDVKRFTLDVSAYYNRFRNFIGSINVIEPKSGTAGELSGLADIKTRNYNSYRIWVNSESKVNTLGLSFALSYTIKNITPYFNYTYSKFFDKNLSDNLIPGFNTPPHKFNIGVMGNRVWKGLGFSANFRWSDAFDWQSPFANGPVEKIHTLDLELNYEVDKIGSVFRVGASNIYNNRVKYAAGAAEIGAFVYGSWTYNFSFRDN